MTIVEAIVAATILLVALLAAFLALDSASSAGKTAERQAIAAGVAEEQLERMLAMSWSELVHCSTPPTSSVARHPLSYVQTGSPTRFRVMQDYRRPELGVLGGTPSGGEQLVVSASSPCDATRNDAVYAGPIPFTSGPVSGSYYRFITWRDDTCLPNLPGDLENLLDGITGLVSGLLTSIQSRIGTGVNAFCLAPNDAKRVSVAVVLDDAGDYGPANPTWVSTVQTNGADGLIIDTNTRFTFDG